MRAGCCVCCRWPCQGFAATLGPGAVGSMPLSRSRASRSAASAFPSMSKAVDINKFVGATRMHMAREEVRSGAMSSSDSDDVLSSEGGRSSAGSPQGVRGEESSDEDGGCVHERFLERKFGGASVLAARVCERGRSAAALCSPVIHAAAWRPAMRSRSSPRAAAHCAGTKLEGLCDPERRQQVIEGLGCSDEALKGAGVPLGTRRWLLDGVVGEQDLRSRIWQAVVCPPQISAFLQKEGRGLDEVRHVCVRPVPLAILRWHRQSRVLLASELAAGRAGTGRAPAWCVGPPSREQGSRIDGADRVWDEPEVERTCGQTLRRHLRQAPATGGIWPCADSDKCGHGVQAMKLSDAEMKRLEWPLGVRCHVLVLAKRGLYTCTDTHTRTHARARTRAHTHTHLYIWSERQGVRQWRQPRSPACTTDACTACLLPLASRAVQEESMRKDEKHAMEALAELPVKAQEFLRREFVSSLPLGVRKHFLRTAAQWPQSLLLRAAPPIGTRTSDACARAARACVRAYERVYVCVRVCARVRTRVCVSWLREPDMRGQYGGDVCACASHICTYPHAHNCRILGARVAGARGAAQQRRGGGPGGRGRGGWAEGRQVSG